MHADTLYHRMLDHEAAVEQAKAEGRPVPVFEPVMPGSTPSPSSSSSSSFASNKIPTTTTTHSTPNPPSSSSSSSSSPHSTNTTIPSNSSRSSNTSNTSSSTSTSSSSTSNTSNTSKTSTNKAGSFEIPNNLTPTARAQLDERLKLLAGEAEREMEARAFVAEMDSTREAMERFNRERDQSDRARARRREKGHETFSDIITRTFRF